MLNTSPWQLLVAECRGGGSALPRVAAGFSGVSVIVLLGEGEEGIVLVQRDWLVSSSALTPAKCAVLKY